MIKEADALTQSKLEIEMDIISSEIALIIEYVEGMNPAPANELMVQLDAKITLIRQKAARQEFDDELMQLWKEVGDIRDASVKINT